jgi:hypothetical protein
MKISIPSFLTFATLALALQTDIASPADHNPLNQQDQLDHCQLRKTVTQPYEAAYKQKNGACPNEYWKISTHGCCPEDAAGKTLGRKGIACCHCGATCTGYLPTPRDWAKGFGNFWGIRLVMRTLWLQWASLIEILSSYSRSCAGISERFDDVMWWQRSEDRNRRLRNVCPRRQKVTL